MSEAAWRIAFAPAAERELRRLPSDVAARLETPIRALGEDPWPTGCRRVQGTEFWRIRMGDVRVVYAIDERVRRVVILRVARRAESTYRRLR